MDLVEVSKDINEKACDYKIGQLQIFRARTKNLKKVKSYNIFPDTPINENWTFHIGGRTELQFNIGIEDEELRYGIAFSLQPSRNMPNPEMLYPKMRRLNCVIRSNPEIFTEYSMWCWYNGERTPTYKVREIKEKEIFSGNFIFIGKKTEEYNLEKIMKDFDILYDVYQEVESENPLLENLQESAKGFEFKKSNYKLPTSRNYSTLQKEIDIVIRHSILQEKLVLELEKEYGKENVSVECNLDGKRIDVVVQDKEGNIFYEVKVCNTALSCIREAIGQLLEYSYFPDCNNAKRLVIVGESELDDKTETYLKTLTSKFNLPLEYRQVKIDD